MAEGLDGTRYRRTFTVPGRRGWETPIASDQPMHDTNKAAMTEYTRRRNLRAVADTATFDGIVSTTPDGSVILQYSIEVVIEHV